MCLKSNFNYLAGVSWARAAEDFLPFFTTLGGGAELEAEDFLPLFLTSARGGGGGEGSAAGALAVDFLRGRAIVNYFRLESSSENDATRWSSSDK